MSFDSLPDLNKLANHEIFPRRLHRTSSGFREHDYDPSTSYVHPTDKKIYSHESSTGTGKALPPVNKTKNSNNIDISELVRNPPEDIPTRGKTLAKQFQHEKALSMTHGLNSSQRASTSNVLNTSIGSSKGHGVSSSHGGLNFSHRLNSSHGQHKPLPNVRKHSNNSESCVDGALREHAENALETRLGSVGHANGKSYTTSGGKGVVLKERNASVERLRSGLLVSVVYFASEYMRSAPYRYQWEIFSCFNRKMDFYLTASPSPSPCIEITWIMSIVFSSNFLTSLFC